MLAFAIPSRLSVDELANIFATDGKRLASMGKAPLSSQYDKAVRALVGMRREGRGRLTLNEFSQKAGIPVITLNQKRPEWEAIRAALDDENLIVEDCGWKLNNVMFWLENLGLSYKRRPVREVITKRIKGCSAAKKLLVELGYSLEDLITLYEKRGEKLAGKGRSPWGSTIVQKPDRITAESQLVRILASLKYKFPQYPYLMEKKEARTFFSSDRHNELPMEAKSELMDLVLRASQYGFGKINFFNGIFGRDAIFASKHFLIETLYPFFLMVMLVTGWNLSSILAITDDLDAHLEDDLIDNNKYVIICSKKRKGGRRKWRKNEITHRSHRDRPFDVYKLLEYVHSIISQYKESPHYLKGEIWQYTVASHSKAKFLINSLSNTNFTFVSRDFVRRHQLASFEKGEAIDQTRIRPGWVTLRQLLDRTPYEISDELNHRGKNQVETTMKHYASDDSSNAVMDLGIKDLQNQFITDFTEYKAKIVEVKYLQELRDGINKARNKVEHDDFLKRSAEEINIEVNKLVHILSPGAQKYIAVCLDGYKPTWPGNDAYISQGDVCKYFNKCCLCKQAVIFPEALPYVACRVLDLERLQNELLPVEWSNIYGEEYEAWSSILDHWNDAEQIAEAKNLARTGAVVLPQVMRGV